MWMRTRTVAGRIAGSTNGPAAPARVRRGYWLAAAAALLMAAPAWVRADDYDRWYTIDMAGGRAGWMHNAQKTEGDTITTTTEATFSLGRAQSPITVSIDGSFVETAAGKPVSMHTVMKLGNMPTTMDCTFAPTEMKIKLSQAGNITDMTRPLPEGTWLTPAAAGNYIKQRLAAKADVISVRTIDPGAGMDPVAALTPAMITHKDCRPETVKAMGKEVQAVRCITTTSTQPGIESVEFLDENGVPVRSEMSMGVMSMTMIAADKAEAQAARPGPELMVSTFVKPDRAIERPREKSNAIYLVSVPDGKLTDLPTTGTQHVEAQGEKAARVTVNAKKPSPAPAADIDDAAFRKASATVNSDDPEVRKLARAATDGMGPGKAARAEAMRRYVHTFIKTKDLDVGFATASEVARTREGDCTEHGVLLAALLRADGIPSRVVCGLIYADGFAGAKNIFGYHMWAQALLEVGGKPSWVDLDATLGPETPYDATHIALAVSSLADGEAQDALMALATIIGRLKIKVESVE